ncbi:MAG TPA: glycosyltransferase [Candidatus Nanoarchaeia archaeon]|nr:glycosyltransferase [Candidatus Nanoarchaeia archaeon]
MIDVSDTILIGAYFFLMFLSIFWLLVLFAGEPEKPKAKLKKYPSFTAIIPAYNEEETIQGTLQSLAELDYPAELMQIIVVNDGSTDRTKEKVEAFMQNHLGLAITLVNQPNRGKGNALNAALQHTTGEFYACLDADSFVYPRALKEMLPYFADAEVAAVCPLLKVKNPDSILRKVQWHEYLINMFYKFLNAKLDCIHVTPGPFSVYRTSIVKALGGYDEKTLTEDLEIAIRLQKHQYKIIQTFDAVVETVAPDTWRALFSQRIRWYKGSIDNAISYRKLMFNKAYGDFGFLRMPTIIITGAVALILIVTIMQDTLSKLGQKIVAYADINFDIITLLRNFRFEFNFLSLPFFKIFVAMVVLSLSFYVMIKSYHVVKEKITHYGRTWISLLTYLFIYSIFISFVWLYIAFLFLTGKKKTWQ